MKSKTAFSPEVIDRVREESNGMCELGHFIEDHKPHAAHDPDHMTWKSRNKKHPMVADYMNCRAVERFTCHALITKESGKYAGDTRYLDLIYLAKQADVELPRIEFQKFFMAIRDHLIVTGTAASGEWVENPFWDNLK